MFEGLSTPLRSSRRGRLRGALHPTWCSGFVSRTSMNERDCTYLTQFRVAEYDVFTSRRCKAVIAVRRSTRQWLKGDVCDGSLAVLVFILGKHTTSQALFTPVAVCRGRLWSHGPQPSSLTFTANGKFLKRGNPRLCRLSATN